MTMEEFNFDKDPMDSKWNLEGRIVLRRILLIRLHNRGIIELKLRTIFGNLILGVDK